MSEDFRSRAEQVLIAYKTALEAAPDEVISIAALAKALFPASVHWNGWELTYGGEVELPKRPDGVYHLPFEEPV